MEIESISTIQLHKILSVLEIKKNENIIIRYDEKILKVEHKKNRKISWIKFIPKKMTHCNESSSLRLAQKFGISVPRLEAEIQYKDLHILKLSSIKGKSFSLSQNELLNKQRLKALAITLSNLHSIKFPFCGYYNHKSKPIKIYSSYYNFLQKTRKSFPIQIERLNDFEKDIVIKSDQLIDINSTRYGGECVLTHRDLSRKNIFYSYPEKEVSLLDFEYSMAADRMADIVILFQLLLKDVSHRSEFIDLYQNLACTKLFISSDFFKNAKFRTFYVIAALNRLSASISNNWINHKAHSLSCLEEVLTNT